MHGSSLEMKVTPMKHIFDSKENMKCSIEGIVTRINVQNQPWYVSCSDCMKKTSHTCGEKFICEHCNKSATAEARCILRLQITDDTFTTWITLFGPNAEKILACTADELKSLPPEMREAQERKLEELKKQQEVQTRLALERKIHLRDRRIKFFERRKIERMIRRLEKQQRSSSDHNLDEKLSNQLSKLRGDLEYVRFFPKTEKYVPLFVGGDNIEIVDKRNKLRERIKANLISAAASGKDLEETASDDDALDISGDDFFLSGSSSDEADADDELTDKTSRDAASSASGKATSGMSSDEKNQREISARMLMPPPRPLPPSRKRSLPKVGQSPASSNKARGRTGSSSFNTRRDHSSTVSSNSDAHKPRRKRRPKKKKQHV